MKNIFKISLYFSLICAPLAFSMDGPPPAPENVPALKVANIFYRAMYCELIAVKINKSEYPLIGRDINTEEFNTQVYWLSVSNIKNKMSSESAQLYKFLEDNKFLQRIGKIFCTNLLEKKHIPTALKPLKKDILNFISRGFSPEEGDSMSFLVTDPKASDKLFDVISWGLIFPKPGSPVKNTDLDPDILWLFTPNEQVKNVFAELSKVSKEIEENFQKLKISWKLGRNSWKFAEESIQKNKLGTSLFRKQLAQRGDISKEVVYDNISKEIDLIHSVQGERIMGMKLLDPTPINLMLLYCFYILEKDVCFILQNIPNYAWYRSLHLIDAEYDSPQITLLAPIANQVLSMLGFSLSDISDIDISDIKDEPANFELPKSFPKNKKQKKRKIKSAKPLTSEPKKEIFFEKKKPAQIIYSSSENGFALERTRGHCALDMLAFLLKESLYREASSSGGTVALVLIKDSMGQDKFVTATKHNLPPDIIRNIFKDIVKEELLKPRDCEKAKKLALKAKFYETDSNEISKELCEKDRYKASLEKKGYREEIYKIRLRNIIKNPKTILEQRIVALLKQTEIPLNILANPFEMHPELKLAEYTLKRRYHLEFLPVEQNSKPYQYIGCSMLNCAMCTGVIQGAQNIRGLNQVQENYLVFFSKGSFLATYTGFFIPECSRKINQIKLSSMLEHLNALGPCAYSYDKSTLFHIESGELR